LLVPLYLRFPYMVNSTLQEKELDLQNLEDSSIQLDKEDTHFDL